MDDWSLGTVKIKKIREEGLIHKHITYEGRIVGACALEGYSLNKSFENEYWIGQMVPVKYKMVTEGQGYKKLGHKDEFAVFEILED